MFTGNVKPLPVPERIEGRVRKEEKKTMSETKSEGENKRNDLHKNLCNEMYEVALLLIKKTKTRMAKETKISRRTLKMVSLVEKLFLAFRTWGI